MVALHVYNTLTRQKELFVPRDPQHVKIYSCGPTVYGDPHIGNLRAFTCAGLFGDTIRHVLGLSVQHTMNITDVGHLTDDGDQGEDKMEKGAKREGLTARDIAKKYENNFKQYIHQLGIYFDYLPRATDHMQGQIAVVQMLEEKGYTYEIPGDGIYMDTSKVDDYGKLMGPNYKKHLAGLDAGVRIDDAKKKHPTDFALWKFSPADEQRQMEWNSPWGKGFPGWHIECSVMARATLGDQIDIHTGGVDHITVHHTNEIVQSECSFADKNWVNYRLHVQFLNINDEKISKSLGNSIMLPDIIAQGFAPADVRLFFLKAQYRSFQDFTRDALMAAKQERSGLQSKIKALFGEQDIIETKKDITYESLRSELTDAFIVDLLDEMMMHLLDDFNTPEMLAKLHHGLHVINKGDVEIDINELFVVLDWLDRYILKISLFGGLASENIPAEIEKLAKERLYAKKKKDFVTADMLRAQIQSQGWELKDTPGGYELTRK